MSDNLFKLTLNAIDQGKIMKTLAEEHRKDINHHIFRGVTFQASDVIKMFDKVQQKYQEETNIENSLNWIEHQKKAFHCFLLAYVCTHHRKIIEITKCQWQSFSCLFNNKNPLLLQYEAKVIQKSQERVKWAYFEENLLHQCIRNSDQPKWTELSRDIFIKSKGFHFKTPKQCRQHWNNHLNERIYRQGWSVEQDLILLDFVAQKGRRWAKLAPLLHHKRTQHMIKNRYHSMLTYARKMMKNQHQAYVSELEVIPFIRKKLREQQPGEQPIQMRETSDLVQNNLEEQSAQIPQNQYQQEPILKVQGHETIIRVKNEAKDNHIKTQNFPINFQGNEGWRRGAQNGRISDMWSYPFYPQQLWYFNMPPPIYSSFPPCSPF